MVNTDYEKNEERKRSLEKNDLIAWEDVADLTRRITYGLTRRGLPNAEADDLSQEVACKVWRNIGNYDPSYALGTWIKTIARRTMIDNLRKRKGERSLNRKIEETSENPHNERRNEGSALPEELQSEIMRLPNKENDVLEHVYFRALTLEEYAKLQEIPIGTAKSRLHYALSNLRKRLTDKRFCH